MTKGGRGEGRGGRMRPERRRGGEKKKRRKREGKKRVAKEVKAVAENVAEKRGWTKESATARKVARERPALRALSSPGRRRKALSARVSRSACSCVNGETT